MPLVPPDMSESEMMCCVVLCSTSFTGYGGMDYYGDDRSVLTEDAGPGLVVADETECMQACIDLTEQSCNAVSYYGNMPSTEW
jgi:hypothetical protein